MTSSESKCRFFYDSHNGSYRIDSNRELECSSGQFEGWVGVKMYKNSLKYPHKRHEKDRVTKPCKNAETRKL